ncbi:hypothetical protein ROLI_025760 [Roseobacter fucihabitans]|uniref:Uncharacterized protein n=1 Tax=Roseobacter fucihabitans TaxID=1537242 RepID=A0ABZ2BVW9_9RHOB|nr:hypothetical protein [Roseobacter litoralis]MBC6965639.1 hypothetical protein [Roseobacter litoralis]
MEEVKKPVKSKKIDLKFWTIAGMIAAVLGFNIAETLVLDADEDDIGYARMIIPDTRVSNPLPGDVYVFNHDINDFVESKICSLQTYATVAPVEAKLSASNIWGAGVNKTMDSVGGWVGEKIIGLAKVDSPQKDWSYSKTHRPAVNAPMNPACLQTVVAMAANISLTPFVVDSIYEVHGGENVSKWVRFANPLMIDPSSCTQCPQPKTVRDIIGADAFTRMKVDWNIVEIN